MHATIDRANEIGSLWVAMAQLALDSHSVVAMRLMGMSGVWSVSSDENTAMVREKLPAFTESIVAAGLAAVAGSDPDRVLKAALLPISDKARDNRRRLARQGPRLSGWTENPLPIRNAERSDSQ